MLTDFKIDDLRNLLLLFFGGSMVLINNAFVHTLMHIKSLFYVTTFSCHLLYGNNVAQQTDCTYWR